MNLEARLREALELLKRSAGFASASPTIGGHKLNDEICRFREVVQAELEINAYQQRCTCGDPLCLRSAPNQEQSHD